MKKTYIQPMTHLTKVVLIGILGASGGNVSNEKKNNVIADAPQRLGKAYL